MRLSFRAEVQLTPKQRQAFLQHAGNARWAYNWGLSKHQTAYNQWVAEGKPKRWGKWPTAISLHKELNVLKKTAPEVGGVPWMYEASKCAPQEALRNLDRAFKNFFKGLGRYPKRKQRSRGIGGFRLGGVIKVNRSGITLPRIGRVRFQPGERDYLPHGPYSQVTVTEHAGRWFVSVVGPEVEAAEPNGKPEVGVDLGVARLATLSDGTVYENPRAWAQSQKKLKRLQKALARKKKGSSNRVKARARLARAYLRVTNVRRDALHKVTTALAKSHGVVCIEDLQVQNMTRGTKGRGRKAKAGLNRSILDVGFGEFRRLLEYKGYLYGCEVLAVPPAYTSQRCAECGHTEAGNRQTQSAFKCLACEHQTHADLNAAINILAAGSCPEALNACGEDVRPLPIPVGRRTSVKQESVVA